MVYRMQTEGVRTSENETIVSSSSKQTGKRESVVRTEKKGKNFPVALHVFLFPQQPNKRWARSLKLNNEKQYLVRARIKYA